LIIKNISTRVVRLEDFPDEKPLLPGQTLDLSRYTPAQRAQSEQLEELFTRRILTNLGYAPTSKKLSGSRIQRTPLGKYSYQEPDLNSTLVPSSKMMPDTSEVPLRKELPKATTAPERYNKEALDQYKYELANEQEKVPEFIEKQFETQKMHSFVQVQNEDHLVTLSIDEETGTVFSELPPGQIPTSFPKDDGVFADKATYTMEEMEDSNLQKQILKDRLTKVIQTRVSSQCLFPRTDGKPCRRQVYHGYDRCFFHLKEEDKDKIRGAKEAKKEPEKQQDAVPQRLPSTELD
jgi:hypothetical protein